MANDQRLTTNDLLLYYITDRTAFPGDESARRSRLLEKIAEAVRAGVDYIQLREKDLSARELESLAREAVGVMNQRKTRNPELKTRLLINSRTDVALAVGADGVHLRSEDVSPQEVRGIWKEGHGVIGVSCHSAGEVGQAAANGASFAVFGPVFEKKEASVTPAGLALLKQACQEKIPVFALGGVTVANAHSCAEAGAAGIAGIRLFQENEIAEVERQLRAT